MDEHDLVKLVKDLAIELGREPTRAEFTTRVAGADYALNKMGGFGVLLQAAGLKSYSQRRAGTKITSAVFERPIVKHLEEYERPSLPPSKPGVWRKTLFIGDVHAPFANLQCLQAIYEFAAKHQPEVIVQVGDLYDMYSHAKFPRSHNIFTPRDEQKAARAQAETMWSELKKAAPKADCFQLYGNHDVRVLKRVLESYPSAEDWVAQMLKEAMSFPGVTTLDDARSELMLEGNVMVHHGYLSQLGRHRDYALHNVVVGHSHTGGIVFKQIRDQILWELNCGYVGDQNAKGLTYTAQRTVPWTNGWGWLDEYGPRFIPFQKDRVDD